MNHFHAKLMAALIVVASLTACSSNDEQQTLLTRLHAELPTGTPLSQAEAVLRTRGATFSKRTAQECDALVRESRVPTQLQPQGGPCVFGKILVSRSWYGQRSDVVLQLVFGADGKLRDGSFEVISTFL